MCPRPIDKTLGASRSGLAWWHSGGRRPCLSGPIEIPATQVKTVQSFGGVKEATYEMTGGQQHYGASKHIEEEQI